MSDPDQGLRLIPMYKVGFWEFIKLCCWIAPLEYWCCDPRTTYFKCFDCIPDPDILAKGGLKAAALSVHSQNQIS